MPIGIISITKEVERKLKYKKIKFFLEGRFPVTLFLLTLEIKLLNL